MKYVLSFYLILSILPVHADSPKLVEVLDSNVLFLAHFNRSLKPEIGNTENMAQQAVITSGKKGVVFSKSYPQPECADLSVYRSFLAYPGERNIDIKNGTIQFWIKPLWKRTGYVHSVFFKFHNNPENRDGIEWKGSNAFYIQKPPHKENYSLSHIKKINKDIPHGPVWHQLAATWSAKAGKFSFYVDGELVGTEKYQVPTKVPRELIFGSPDLHFARSLLDEVRILNYPLSPEEIKQDYLAQKAGLEFDHKSSGTGNKTSILKFSPEMPEAKVASTSKFEDIALPVQYTLQAPKIDASLDDPAWKKAITLPRMLTPKGHPAKVPTELKLLYDNKNLYLSAVVNEPEMKTIIAKFDQRDLKIFNDDCVEFILKLPGRDRNIFHFVVNSLGTIYDSRNGKLNFDAKNLKAKTRRLADKWLLEMQLSFSDLKTSPPQVGVVWGARFCRERHNLKAEFSSIPSTRNGAFSAPNYLGKLTFMGGANSSSTLKVSVDKKTFFPGLNSFKISLDNDKPEKIKGELNIYTLNSANELLEFNSRPVTLKPGKNILNIPVKVVNDKTNLIGITIKLASGAPVCSLSIPCGVSPVSPSVTKLAKELPDLKNIIRMYNDTKHPLYKGMKDAVEEVSKAISTYERQLQLALENQTVVSLNDWNKVAACVNGFNKFRLNRRYLIWQTSLWEKSSPDALAPLNYHESPSCSFSLAGNEQEAVCFIIAGGLCEKRLDLRIVPNPTVMKGKYIPAKSFTIYSEPFLNHMGEKLTSALIKVPGNIITLTPGSLQRIWIIFNSRGLQAGNYKTSITVKPLNDYSIPNRNIPVSLRIFNFTLPETHDWPLDCYFWKSSWSEVNETAMLKMLHDRHIKWAMTDSYIYHHGYKPGGTIHAKKTKSIDKNRVTNANKDFFETALKLKMKIVFAWGTPASVEWHKLMVKRLLDMGFSYRDFIFHGALRDEFKAKDINKPGGIKLRKELHQAIPDAQFMATLLNIPPPSGATLKQIKQAGLLDFFKVWAISNGVTDSTINELRQYKRTVWAYRCQRNMQTRSILDYYRFFPWVGYFKKLDGVAFWTFYSRKGTDGFDHRDGYDDGMTLIDSDNRPVPSKQLEAVREGLEDVAYMDILKKHLEKAEKNKPAKGYSKYRKLLDKVPQKIMRDKSLQLLKQWRLDVANAIENLKKDEKH